MALYPGMRNPSITSDIHRNLSALMGYMMSQHERESYVESLYYLAKKTKQPFSELAKKLVDSMISRLELHSGSDEFHEALDTAKIQVFEDWMAYAHKKYPNLEQQYSLASPIADTTEVPYGGHYMAFGHDNPGENLILWEIDEDFSISTIAFKELRSIFRNDNPTFRNDNPTHSDWRPVSNCIASGRYDPDKQTTSLAVARGNIVPRKDSDPIKYARTLNRIARTLDLTFNSPKIINFDQDWI